MSTSGGPVRLAPADLSGPDRHDLDRAARVHRPDLWAGIRADRPARPARHGGDRPRYEDCVYHGVQDDGSDEEREWRPARLLVEKPERGPTERERVTVLRELPEPEHGGFGWGYNGGGTSRAAAAVLTDALELGTDPDRCGIGIAAYPENDTLIQLREDFAEEVLSQFCDGWRLRRGAVLRWARGWYLQEGITDVPPALRRLPPAGYRIPNR